MVKITGRGGVSGKLGRLSGPEVVREIGAVLLAGGSAIEVEAAISITNGNKSGNVYTHRFATINGKVVPVEKRATPHQASAPGEAPADDDGDLARGIATVQLSPLKVEVSSSAAHAGYMEYGTSKIAPRPYMAPAAAKVRPQVLKDAKAAIRRIRDCGRVSNGR